MKPGYCYIALAIAWVLGASAPALGQDAGERTAAAELKRIESDFEYGRYAEVLSATESRLEQGGLGDEARVELHRLAGLAALNLGRTDEARRHFRALLRIEPDHALDPFRVPPPAIAAFDETRRELAPELPVIRARRAAREAAEREEEEARRRERSELEELRAELSELNKRVTMRVVERQHILVNFVPFGMGQFQQGRNGVGLGLAVAQGALAATSLVAYFTRWTLRTRVTESISGRVGEDPFVREIWLLPNARRGEDEAWAAIQYSSGIAFFGAYAFGIVDALINHRDTTSTIAGEASPNEGQLLPVPRLLITPLPGGAAAGFSLRF